MRSCMPRVGEVIDNQLLLEFFRRGSIADAGEGLGGGTANPHIVTSIEPVEGFSARSMIVGPERKNRVSPVRRVRVLRLPHDQVEESRPGIFCRAI